MITKVILPKLGQTMAGGGIEAWHKSVGDTVKVGDVLYEMSTDKATQEVEAMSGGTLLAVFAPEGTEVAVNEVVALLGEPGEAVPAEFENYKPQAPSDAEPEPAPKKAAPKKAAASSGTSTATSTATAAPAAPSTSSAVAEHAAPAPTTMRAPFTIPDLPADGRVFASPRAKRLAREKEVPYEILDGSGPNGRVVENDVEQYLADLGQRVVTPTARRMAYQKNVDLRWVRGTGDNGRIERADVEAARQSYPHGGLQRVELTGMRKAIAERMAYAQAMIPQFQLTGWVNMKAALDMRAKAKAEGRAWTISDLITAAVSKAIVEVPQMGDLFAGDHVVRRHRIHVGLAVALEPPGSGLIVPVMRDVDRKSLDQLAAERRELTSRARVGRLKPDEYQGGIFTVSNLGVFDIDSFVAVVQPGEAGILAIGKVAPRVVAEGDAICVRQTMFITLSADHRVVDGADGARFLQAVKSALENPAQLDA